MYLQKISIHNYKNIGDCSLEFSPKLNCVNGNNGCGKTNLLDAVYYLSMTKSFFLHGDQYTFRYGESEAALVGDYVSADETLERISVALHKGGEKNIRRGSKPYTRLADHIGLIPIVMVSPADSSLINESGEERRRFMNALLSQTDRRYLRSMQAYNQFLMQRNKMLKMENPDPILLGTINEQIAPYADYIYNKRKELCTELRPLVEDYYAKLSGDAEPISMHYHSDLKDGSLTRLLEEEAEKERILKYTTVGIQRDDIFFNLGGHPIKKCGSQGQQKTFLLALKLAQQALMRNLYGFSPILLLDDVFDKLDMHRVENLLKLVASEEFGQIFITDSNKVRISEVVSRAGADCSIFTVENGEYKKE